MISEQLLDHKNLLLILKYLQRPKTGQTHFSIEVQELSQIRLDLQIVQHFASIKLQKERFKILIKVETQ
jgi:hypothetical protein